MQHPFRHDGEHKKYSELVLDYAAMYISTYSEFAECCEVTDLKIFGKSIIKMFIQKNSIVKWILTHYFTSLKALEK